MLADCTLVKFPDDRKNGEFEVRNRYGLLVWTGEVKEGKLNGVVCCYQNGELVMRIHMQNNEKHGEYFQYEHGEVVLYGYFYNGVQCGIATKIDKKNNRTYNVQYMDGVVEYELLNDDGENTLVRKDGDKVIERGCYLIHNLRSIPEYCPEGYSLQIDSDEFTLSYVTQTIGENGFTESREIKRVMKGPVMRIYAALNSEQVCIYEGSFDDSFVDRYPRNDQGEEHFECIFDKRWSFSLYGSFKFDRPFRKGQFIDNATKLCFCNAEWDEHSLANITLFNDQGIPVWRGRYEDWEHLQHVNDYSQLLNTLPYTLSDIIIESNVMNTTKFVDLSPYVLTRTIVIRNHCFAGVEQFSCFHLPNLKVLKIENDSFNSSSPGFPIQDKKQRVCIIAYCDSLERVEIGTNCFNWFSQLIVKGHILQDRFICRESAIAVVRSWPN